MNNSTKNQECEPIVLDYQYDYRMDKKTIQRPRIEVILSNGKYNTRSLMLVDSGADTSFISQDIADELQLELGTAYMVRSISGLFKVRRGKINATIRKKDELISIGEISVLVPAEKSDVSNFGRTSLLGRKNFFTQFKITIDECSRQIILNRQSQIDYLK